MNGELFNRAMLNAIFWQNMCCELVEIIELFCEDADSAINAKESGK